MWPEPPHLAKIITVETGLVFEADAGIDAAGERFYRLRPSGLHADHTLAIRTTFGWRRLRIDFEPGKFAAELLAEMGEILSNVVDGGERILMD